MVLRKLVIPFVIVLLVVYLLVKNISSSVFLKEKDRVNVVFYGQNSKFFSLSSSDVNYLVIFPADTEALVPGGYGQYRIGALSKLVSLERKPELFKKTFSSATSTAIDLYFYPKKTEIYYNSSDDSAFPHTVEILFSKSNANTIDRLFLLTKFLDRNQSEYKIISQDGASFQEEEFNKDYQGSFYKKTYRKEGENVQILYTKSYSTATLFSRIIDGEGIRVVDLSRGKKDTKTCRVIAKKVSLTSRELSRYFGCQLVMGETTLSDIILELGNLESEWAVK